MKKREVRILSVLIAVILMFTTQMVPAAAAESTAADNSSSGIRNEISNEADIDGDKAAPEDERGERPDAPPGPPPDGGGAGEPEDKDTFTGVRSDSETGVRYLAFASDRHGYSSRISNAMRGMPENVEYVSIIGDLVGSGRDRAPVFDSSMIRDEILSAGFSKTSAAGDMSILWADHDSGVNDDAGIVFANGGSGSGLMKTGLNADGSVSYYVYGIAFNDMKSENKDAVKAFESWIDSIKDRSVPVIVVCHVPLHYARGDNKGAGLWSAALNYAAVGTETPGAKETASRNVIFLHGHNHTIESIGENSGEFYVPAGSKMEIGPSGGSRQTIYYTYTTAGYLKKNVTATLIAIDNSAITVKKYKAGYVSDDVYASASNKSGEFASEFCTAGTNTIARVKMQDTQDLIRAGAGAWLPWLPAKAVSVSSGRIKVSWNAAAGADSYAVMYAKCGSSGWKKYKTVNKAGKGSILASKLSKNKSYRFRVFAYSNGKKIAASNVLHSIAGDISAHGKWTNAKAVKLKNNTLTVKRYGKSRIKNVKIAAVRSGSTVLLHGERLRFVSSDPEIASVSDKGTVTGLVRGSCRIYVIAHNGVRKSVKLTVN